MAAVVLMGLMLIVMLLRIVAPLGTRTEGKVLRELRLSFRERLGLQRTNLYLLGFVLLLGSLSGWLPTFVELVVIVGAFAILTIPVRYVLTTEGVALNQVVFRRWEEFRAVEAGPRGMYLRGRPGFRDFFLGLGPTSQAVAHGMAAARIAQRDPTRAPRKEVKSALDTKARVNAS